MLAFEALVARVADCLAEEGDEDPVAVRRSKVIGIIAHPARLHDLLLRHADQPDDPSHPEQRVAARQAGPSDPWAAEDLPSAGWETHRHGNYHQPGLDDLDDLDDCQAAQRDSDEPETGQQEEQPAEEADKPDNPTSARTCGDHPPGLISIVTNQGTLLLGDSPWAHAI